ncbi:hypothetical protein B8W95_13880, partial [Staphylococcus pasteuri]
LGANVLGTDQVVDAGTAIARDGNSRESVSHGVVVGRGVGLTVQRCIRALARSETSCRHGKPASTPQSSEFARA